MSPATICLLFLVALLLGVYVGSEVSFGSYVLVYSHQRLDLDEVHTPINIHSRSTLSLIIYRLQSSGQYLTAVYW